MSCRSSDSRRDRKSYERAVVDVCGRHGEALGRAVRRSISFIARFVDRHTIGTEDAPALSTGACEERRQMLDVSAVANQFTQGFLRAMLRGKEDAFDDRVDPLLQLLDR